MKLTRIWFDSPGVRWRPVLVAALLLSLLAWAWIAHERELWTASDAVVLVSGRAAPAASAVAARRPASAVTLAQLARPAVAPAAPAPASAPTGEPCPPGAFGAVLNHAQLLDAPRERRIAEHRSRWLAALQSSGDERVRAAGWLLGLQMLPDAIAGSPDEQRASCAGDATCEAQLVAALTAATYQQSTLVRERLATLAAGSRDPLVQAYALRACQGERVREGGCAALSPLGWARLEPDNAAAWMAVVSDPRSDAQQQNEALLQAGRATRVELHAATMQTLVRSAQPPGGGEIDRLLMGRELMRMNAGWSAASSLPQVCDAQALRDPARRPSCEAVAELLIAKAPTLQDLIAARELGERLAWPADRLATLRSETDALRIQQAQRLDGREPLTCAALPTTNAFFAEVGRAGELAALRQTLPRSGR
jgi:hypothetical protein